MWPYRILGLWALAFGTLSGALHMGCQPRSAASPPKQVPPSCSTPTAAAVSAVPPGASVSATVGPRVPELMIDATGVKLDGAVVSLVVKERLQRMDNLFAAFKQQRRQFPPSDPPPPYRMTLAEGTDLITLKSAFQTVAFSGWPRASLQTPIGSLLLSARVPVPPGHPLAKVATASSSPVVLVLRPTEVELWMNGTIVSDHLPPSSAQGGLGITGLTPENDIRVRVSKWPATSSADAGFSQLSTYCRRSAPCPKIALLASNDTPGTLMRDLLQAVARVCSDAAIADCEIGLLIDDPPISGAPPVLGAATARTEGTEITGPLPPEVVQLVIRSAYDKFRKCYQDGQSRDPKLHGRVAVRFVIGRDGRVTSTELMPDTSLPDAKASQCIRDIFKVLTYPRPEGGIVTVVYPIKFEPGDP